MVETLKIKDDGFPEVATLCQQCKYRALIKMDGQLICLSCGEVERPVDPESAV